MNERITVIGAGLGGIAAAIDLAHRGYAVEVLEASSEPGGKAGIATLDGVRLDTGPSVLTLPDVFDSLFSLSGHSLEGVVELIRPDPSFRYLYPDGAVLDLHPSIEATLTSISSALGHRAAREMQDFLQYSEAIWTAAGPRFVYGDAPSFGGLLQAGWSAIRDLSRIDPFTSMKAAIDARVSDPRLAALLLRYATYNGSDARRAPATLNCIAHVELALGGFGVRGGIHALVQALVTSARTLGVDFTFEERVERIVVQSGKVVAVESSRGRTRTDAVVANADAAHVFTELLPRPRRIDDERSMSGWTALIRTPRRSDRAAHTVVFPERYLKELVDVFDHGRTPRDPTVYVSAPSVNHGHTGWGEDEALFVMVNAPAVPQTKEPLVEPDVAATVREKLLARGLIAPGAQWLWTRTPEALADRFPGSGGALYGAASNGPSAAFKRPANRVKNVGGLYLASGSAHPGGGMPLAVLSGRAAARALAEDLPCHRRGSSVSR